MMKNKISNISKISNVIINSVICVLASYFIIELLGGFSYDNEIGLKYHLVHFAGLMMLLLSLLKAITNIYLLIKKNNVLFSKRYQSLLLIESITVIVLYVSLLLVALSVYAIYLRFSTLIIFGIIELLLFLYIFLDTVDKKNFYKKVVIILLNALLVSILFNFTIFISYDLNDMFDYLSNAYITNIIGVLFVILMIIGFIKKKTKIYSDKKYICLIAVACFCLLFPNIEFKNDLIRIIINYILMIGFFVSIYIILVMHLKNIKKTDKFLRLFKILLVIIMTIISMVFLVTGMNDYFDERKTYSKAEKEFYSIIENKNEYYNPAYKEIEKQTSFNITSYDNVISTYYSLLNSDFKKIIVRCEYDNCFSAFNISENKKSYYNDLVNVYNQADISPTFSEDFNGYKYVALKKARKYKESEIEKINDEINRIYNEVYDYNLSDVENIRKFHDYIIDNTKFINYKTNSAINLLFKHKSTSVGYNEVMSLILNKMDIPNFRITSNEIKNNPNYAYHPWLVVKIDGKWLHLDLGWDDDDNPYLDEYSRYKYFLITDQQLKSINDVNHNYNREMYDMIK